MRCRKYINSYIKFIIISIIISFLGFTIYPRVSLAEISVKIYCQLHLECMQLEESYLNELISIVKQYQEDSDDLEQQLEKKREESDVTKEDLYSSYETTSEEYINYMSKHGDEVDAYLKDNNDIKQQMDDLSQTINSLLDEFESLMKKIKGIDTEPSGPPKD